MDALSPCVVFAPLTAAAVLAGLTSIAKRAVVDTVALVGAVTTLVLTVALWHRTLDHRVVHWFSGWKPHRGLAVAVGLTADPLSAGVAVLIALLTLCALVYAWRHLESGSHHLPVLILLFEGGLIGFALSGDRFIMFVFFELMSVAAYALTALLVTDRGPLEGAINFALINSLGSFALLLGIALLYADTGALNLAQMGQALAAHPPSPAAVLGIGLVTVGFLVKAAVVPFHFWLADAHAVAPTPACVLFSGVMAEIGVFGVARVYWTAFAGAVGPHQHAFGLVLVAGGAVSVVVASVMCFSQQHLKRLLAFSTIAHVGMVLVGVGLMSTDGLAGAALYVIGHGAVKAALFLLAGIVLHRTGSLDDEYLRGRARHLKVTGVLFAIGGLALAGLPPFGLSLGKGMIEDAGHHYAWLPWLFLFGSALTGGAVLRAAGRMFLGLGPDESNTEPADRYGESEEERETRDAADRTPFVLMAPAVVLLLVGLAIGLTPHLAQHTETVAGQFRDRAHYASAVLDGRDGRIAVETKVPKAAGTWWSLASALSAVAVAAAALFRRRMVDASVRARARVLGAPVRALRRLHDGYIGDYAAWFTVGLACVCGSFALLVR
ncbi:MAG: NADH dehydrogenase [Actinobacteria bacterium]|nr:NADH dehydrogenase [Actinomycetota bacterium]